jgi:hypothetical protein
MFVFLLEIAFATTAFAEVSHRKVAPDIRRAQPASADGGRIGFILRQDLFDRNNPNNLRSDWPGPPAQPGQF